MHVFQSCAGFCLDFVLCVCLIIAGSGISERNTFTSHMNYYKSTAHSCVCASVYQNENIIVSLMKNHNQRDEIYVILQCCNWSDNTMCLTIVRQWHKIVLIYCCLLYIHFPSIHE